MNAQKLYQWVRQESKTWAGVVRSQSSHLRKIAGMSRGRAESQRRRLQRFVKQQQPMEAFFKGWTKSVVKALRDRGHRKQQPLVLVVDETKLKAMFGVMVVGVVYAGRCIPLAWAVYRANSQVDYPAEGQVRLIAGLLQAIHAGIPPGQRVRVLADRGIGTSPDLMREVMALGWTFLFRVTKQSKIVLPSGEAVCFYDQVTARGERYDASGRVFKNRAHLPAHVRVLWGEHAKECWSLVTNDPTLTGWEYAQRMWIEAAFRDLKSHGWQVEAAMLTCPRRMTHLWILLVVAYAWMLLLGAAIAAQGLAAALNRRADGTRVRRWSLFREGRQAFLATSPPFVT